MTELHDEDPLPADAKVRILEDHGPGNGWRIEITRNGVRMHLLRRYATAQEAFEDFMRSEHAPA